MDDTLKYFLKYVKIDTQSDDKSSTCPSSKKQLNLAKELLKDLENLGIEGAFIDEFGQVHAFIEGAKGVETIGFNAHMDTALEASGKNVKPRIIENYDGEDIELNPNKKTEVRTFPFLKRFIGQTLVVTDGTTLLGADDKAGLSIIMNLVKYIKENPKFKHHPISILFTVDEEIGRGADHFDAKSFKADYAYTLDGVSPYIISYENFNAAHAVLEIEGVSIHPGEAKGKMINPNLLAMEFEALLPKQYPQNTDGYDGFHHLTSFTGDAEKAVLTYILRDHSALKLKMLVEEFEKAKQTIQVRYPKAKINLEIGYDYKNMAEILKKDPRALRKIESVYKNMGLEFTYYPIRGGTDGATFSYKGCPCPNLGNGSYNHHGPHEFLVKEEHDLLIEIVKEIVKV